MAQLSFRREQTFLLANAEYKLIRLHEGEIWQIENLATGLFTTRPLDELHELYRTNQLSLTIDQPGGLKIAERIGRVILPDRSQYSDRQIRRACRYEAYLKEFDKLPFVPKRHADLQCLITEIAQTLDDKHPPSPKTLLRARAKWIACARDFRSQIAAFDKCGHRNYFSPAMKWLMEVSLRCTYLTSYKKKITEAWNNLDERVQALNAGNQDLIDKTFTAEEQKQDAFKQLQSSTPLVTPSIYALYRRVKAIPLYDILVAQNGKHYADKSFRTSFPGEKTNRPLARVDGDETKTDIFIIDEIKHLWLGRAYITVLYEAYCHAISGFYMGFEPHSVLAYTRAIRHSILPKTYIAQEYPVINNRWDIHGQAELYNLDNAMAVHSKDFEKIAADLNTIILFDPRESPWFKGLVERFFKTLNTELLHTLPGTTFSHLAEIDGDYDPQKCAVVPYGLLMLMFHKFIVDIHLQKPNRGISDTPALRWANFVHELPPPLPPSAGDLDIILGRRLNKKIWHYGIEIDRLFYQSDELGRLLKRLARKRIEHPLVDVSAPPGDMGYIYVFDPEARSHIRVPVPEEYREYANGLSRHAHKVHLQYTRKYLKGVTDVHALSRAQGDIWRWALEASRLNDTVARYMENHSRDNPSGALVSSELISKMVSKLAGKEAPGDATSLPVSMPSVKKMPADASVEDLPCYEYSNGLPDE
jgi:putative transposase